jgi:hypothetical protein
LYAFVGVAANEPAAQTDERSPEGLCSGDVDASTTPEAARCSTIGGSLVVTGHLHPAFTDAAALDDFDDRLASLGASSDASADEKRNTAPNALLRVEGDVVVAPGAAETSLRGAFPELTHVGGSVILENTNLVILAVFPSLTFVGGDVRVGDNERLLRLGDETFSAFPSLATVVGALHIESNPFLERLEGFEALRSVGGVRVERNAALTSIAPRPARRSERASLSARVTVSEKKRRLIDVPPFPKLSEVVGNGVGVVVQNNGALLTILGAFPTLTKVDSLINDESLRVANEPSLISIAGSFESLESVKNGALIIEACASLETIDASFVKVKIIGGDLSFSRTPKLRLVKGGSFTSIGAVAGSVRVRDTALESLSFLFSLGVVRGDLDVGDGCPNLRSLDGLQNLRAVAGATRVAPESLEGNFGRCGAVSSKFGVTHTCYARGFRMCAPLFPAGGSNPGLKAFEVGATPNARATTVPGWYRCVPTLATALVETPELRTSASVFAAAGLLDALHAPRADVTLFAPTEVAWLKAVGRVGDVLSRAEAIRAVALAHVVVGSRSLFSIKDGHVLPSVAATTSRLVMSSTDTAANAVLGLRASAKFGSAFQTAPVLATRCAAQPGVSEACAPRPTRVVALDPVLAGEERPPVGGRVGDRLDALGAEMEERLAGFDADAGRFFFASGGNGVAESASETSETSETSQMYSSVSRARLMGSLDHDTAAVVVLGDIHCANGVAHIVDAPLAPATLFSPEPISQTPPRPFPGETHDTMSVSVFLQTPPPPTPAAANAPPPVLKPVAAYFTAPPPPPSVIRPPPPPRTPGASAASPPPPPVSGGDSGSCAARAPDICGLCDYTFSETAGVCCCDESCVASGDCCADYQAVCARTR